MTIQKRILLFGLGTVLIFLLMVAGVVAGTSQARTRFRHLQDHASTTKMQTLIIGREVLTRFKVRA